MGLLHSCSVSVDGRVACWGYVGSLNVITTMIWPVTFGNGFGDDLTGTTVVGTLVGGSWARDITNGVSTPHPKWVIICKTQISERVS